MYIQLFKALDKEDQAYLLAKHLPQGKIWDNKFNSDSNLGKLLIGLSVEYYRTGVLLGEMASEIHIDETVKLLETWETSFGIPHSVFKTTTETIERRRQNIKYLLSNFWGVQTAEDFVEVAGYYGYTVTVEAATVNHTFPLSFPIYFFSNKSVKYTIIVSYTSTEIGDSYFPLYFPYYFNEGGIAFIESLFRILVPANVELKFVNTYNPEILYEGAHAFEDVNTNHVFVDIGTNHDFIDLESL